jgi:hypothetical protein
MDIWEQEALGTSKIDVHGKEMQIIKIHATQTCVVISGYDPPACCHACGFHWIKEEEDSSGSAPTHHTHTHKKTLGWDTPVLECPTLAKVYFHKLLFLDNGTDRAFRLRAP